MDVGFDHVTIAVTDLAEARRFFELLEFEVTKETVVTGAEMARYMGIDGWEADHVTLRHTSAPVHQEVQLLRFHRPAISVDEGSGELGRTGFNHLCLRVDDLRSTLDRLAAAGVKPRNEVMHFHDRDLVFLPGPGGVVVELAQWAQGT